MKKIIRGLIVAFAVTIFSGVVQADSYFNDVISPEKLRFLPIPADFRNYFFFQSIDDNSYIIIGDFTAADKIITQIIDKGSANQIDKVLDYYPDSGKTRTSKKSASLFFKDNIDELKKEIISGKIFRDNYTYKMKSLDTLMYKIKDRSDIFQHEHGYTVKFYDPDAPTTIMSEFFFGKKHGRYDLIFRTNYYKLFNSKITPPLIYSVFCRNSKDPVVAEIVESLLKEVKK